MEAANGPGPAVVTRFTEYQSRVLDYFKECYYYLFVPFFVWFTQGNFTIFKSVYPS